MGKSWQRLGINLGLNNKSGINLGINLDWESHDREWISCYFWRLLAFRWTFYKADISIKWALLLCMNGVQIIEIPLWLLKRRWVQPKILMLIINLFSLNFPSREIDGERGNSSQNERTLGGGKGVLENEQGWARGGRGVSKLGSLKRKYFLNVSKLVWFCPACPTESNSFQKNTYPVL